MVLENGSIVSSYTRHDVDPSDTFDIMSVTKGLVSLLFGMLVDDGLLSLDDTLGDIFQDDAAWAGVNDGSTDFRLSVTIEELLTHTSGLFDNPEVFPLMGGQSLQGSLSYPLVGVKGEWAYLMISQIQSYIIKERTGMTPRQYLAENVMGKLGIGEDEYDWEQNEDRIEMGGGFMHLAPMQMAKFGQLYLQGGRTNPFNDDRLISENWIDASFTHHATIDVSSIWGVSETSVMGERLQGRPFGYCFYGLYQHPSGSTVYCAVGGLVNNMICVDRYLGRVMILQREDVPGNPFKSLDLFVDSSLSFRAPNGGLSGISTVESTE